MLLKATLIIISITSVTSAADCDACLNNVCYIRKLIFDPSMRKSGQMSINRVTNMAYFNFQNNSDDWRTAAVNLDDFSFNLLPIKTYTSGITVDEAKNEVYLYASKPGLYKYSYETDELEFMGLTYLTSNKFQYKDETLYFSGLLFGFCFYADIVTSYCYNILESTEVSDFAIDRNNDLYLRSGSRFYRLRSNGNELEYLFTNRFNKIVLDKDDHIVFVNSRIVTKLDENDKEIVIGGFGGNTNVFGAVIDKDNNWVYEDISTTLSRLYKLESKSGKCDVTINWNDVIINYFP